MTTQLMKINGVEILRRVNNGETASDIASEMGVKHSTLYAFLWRRGIHPQGIRRSAVGFFTCERCKSRISGLASKVNGRQFCSATCVHQASTVHGLSTMGYPRTTVNGRRDHQHRHIAERVLGRRLTRKEVVHHINGDKTDNQNCNLLICTLSYHKALHDRMARFYQQEHFPVTQ